MYWTADSVGAIMIGDEPYLENGMTAWYNYGIDNKFLVVFASTHNFISAPFGLGHDLAIRLTKDKVFALSEDGS